MAVDHASAKEAELRKYFETAWGRERKTLSTTKGKRSDGGGGAPADASDVSASLKRGGKGKETATLKNRGRGQVRPIAGKKGEGKKEDDEWSRGEGILKK